MPGISRLKLPAHCSYPPADVLEKKVFGSWPWIIIAASFSRAGRRTPPPLSAWLNWSPARRPTPAPNRLITHGNGKWRRQPCALMFLALKARRRDASRSLRPRVDAPRRKGAVLMPVGKPSNACGTMNERKPAAESFSLLRKLRFPDERSKAPPRTSSVFFLRWPRQCSTLRRAKHLAWQELLCSGSRNQQHLSGSLDRAWRQTPRQMRFLSALQMRNPEFLVALLDYFA